MKRRKKTTDYINEYLAFVTSLVKPFALGIAGGIFIIACMVGIAATGLLWLKNTINPDIAQIQSAQPAQSIKIYDRAGDLLYERYQDAKRTALPLQEMSRHVKEATIAVEDRYFYEHKGVVFESLVRAVLVNFFSNAPVQGGSTITQQMIKNLVLTPQKTALRKLTEIIWALQVEKAYSKDKILELYLNSIPYGRNTYGVEAASLAYFGKSARLLTIAESAYLASIPQAPTYYNPEGTHRSDLDARKNYILYLMYDQDYINFDEYKDALQEQVAFKPLDPPFKAPHFVTWVLDYLVDNYDEELMKSGGLQVYTTIDPETQAMAEETLKEVASSQKQKYRAYNGALVAVNTKTNQILAMVGSTDFFGKPEPAGCKSGRSCLFEPQTNAAASLLQPGSSFKPYVYVTAFSPAFKYSPSSIIDDVQRNFGTSSAPYIPQNYNNQSYGKVSIRKALAGSLNISAVRTASLVGVDSVIKTARSLGISAPLKNCGLAIALGSCEITLVDHVGAFATLNNLGKYNPVTGILKITTNDGKTLETYQPSNEAVLDEQAAYEVVHILTDNKAREYIFGSHTPLEFPDRPVAAKTGTTQNWKDAWTVGGTPSITAGVWVGNNDGSLMASGADGIYSAAPVWRKFMDKIFAGKSPEIFQRPEGIKTVAINTKTGKPLAKSYEGAPTEIFADYALQGNTAHKKVASAETKVEEPGVTLTLEPFVTQVVTTLPDRIAVKNVSEKNLLSLELFVDAKPYKTITSKPYVFTLPPDLTVGAHTVMIWAHTGIKEEPDNEPEKRVGATEDKEDITKPNF